MPLPYKEPSQTLLSLMGICVQAGQRFASIADMQVGDGNQQAAVGTTVALLERGSRVMSAIHKRLYASMKNEFSLLANVFATYLPPEYPYDVVGGNNKIKQTDFDDKIDVLPVADPNIFSSTQRVSIAQTELQLAQSNPQIHNLYEAYRDMYVAIGVKNIDTILPPPEKPAPKNQALEHIDALGGKPFQAFTGQDHQAHISAHLSFMGTTMAQNNPLVMTSLEKNIFEHINLMSDEQVQLEFRDKIAQAQQIAQQMQQDPQMQQQMQANPQMQQQMQQQQQQLELEIESRKAVLIAEMTEDFVKEQKEAIGILGNDPLVKLRARELDLKAQENMRRQKEDDARLNLDKMKSLMNQNLQEDKMEQQEDLAILRATTSIEKQKMSNRAKIKNDQMKQRDVRILKEPRS
jgi:hypothetical protein